MIKPFFRWYDIWIGFYVDLDKKYLYICPIPMFGVRIDIYKPVRTVQRLFGQ